MYSMRRMTDMGMGLTRLEGGSSFFQSASMRPMRQSVFKAEFRQGLSVSIEKNVCGNSRE